MAALSSAKSSRKKTRSQLSKELRRCREELKGLKSKLEDCYRRTTRDDGDFLKKFNDSSESPVEMAHTRLRERRLLEGHFGKVYSIDTSATGELVSGSLDEKVIVWDVATGLKIGVFEDMVKQVTAVCFSTDSKHIAVGGMSNECCIFDKNASSSEPKHEFEGHEGYITACQFLDDNTLATASGDGTIRLWDTQALVCKSVFKDHNGKHVTCMDVNTSDKRTIISSSFDGLVKVWDAREAKQHSTDPLKHPGTGGKATLAPHKGEVTAVRWFPSYTHTFASGGIDSKLRLWDFRTRRPLNVYEVCDEDGHAIREENPAQVYAIEFSKGGRSIFAGVDTAPYCIGFDTITGTANYLLEHSCDVYDLAMDGAGDVLITASWDQLIRFFA